MFTYTFTTFALAVKSLFNFASSPQQQTSEDSDDTIITNAEEMPSSRLEPDEVSDTMADFYEESSPMPEEWKTMSASGKRKRLDGDIEEYMAEKRKKELDQIRD
jgi:hypothetical protein